MSPTWKFAPEFSASSTRPLASDSIPNAAIKSLADTWFTSSSYDASPRYSEVKTDVTGLNSTDKKMLVFELVKFAAVDLNISRWANEGVDIRHPDAQHDAFPNPLVIQMLGAIGGSFNFISPRSENGIRNYCRQNGQGPRGTVILAGLLTIGTRPASYA
ncbi:hypothetical protein [Streptomyces sp. NPDC085665]|uniref:hypothetical protein n=1 Tax=Streptomyces sp. NPDC085665 TaxID=3365735 RepID=UPI0037D6537A